MKDRVLLVEDSRALSALVLAHLESGGYQVTVFATIAECEQDLIDNANNYFAAIVDLNLPDATDGEAVDLVLGYNIPVIVFTSTINPSLRDAILSKGIADYSLKSGQHHLDYVTWMIGRLYRNRQMRVLVVDDADSSRAMLRRLLEIQAFQVETVASAEEALKKLHADHLFKIVITDAVMDGMNGFELTSKIRETCCKKALFILGVSGQESDDTSVRFIKSGANDFISKPFFPEEFFCRINQAADYLDMIEDLSASNAKKEMLLGMAAHDIRNPVGIVKRAAEKLQDRFDGRDAELIAMIGNASDHLLQLLNTLLELSRVEDKNFCLNLSKFNFTRNLNEVIQAQRNDAQRKNITLNANCSDAIKLHGDAILIRQVIENLISNAIKYSPNESAVEIGVVNDGDMTRLSVTDNGPGIREEEVRRLFQPFSKLSNKPTAGESSTGLGLALCERIISAHGGEIGYQPGIKGGSEFYFCVPNNIKT